MSPLRRAEKCGTITPVPGQGTATVDHTTYRRVAAVRERATESCRPRSGFHMPASIPAIRHADRHTQALLNRMRLPPERFGEIFSALTKAFDAGADSSLDKATSGPRAPLGYPDVAPTQKGA